MSDQTGTCANCGRPLDASDKFCRDCGLPTARAASARRPAPAAPPDTGEMRRALNVQAEPQPFVRVEDAAEDEPPAAPETTGDVLRATSPTQAVQMASSTFMMLIGLMVVLAVAGAVLLFLALR